MRKIVRKGTATVGLGVKIRGRAQEVGAAVSPRRRVGSAPVIDTELIQSMKGGLDAMIEGLPQNCHHTVSELRVRVREIMQQANQTPQVVENAKTNARYVLLHEDVFARIIESLGDPVAALMDEFTASGRSAALPEARARYRELRTVQPPNIEPAFTVEQAYTAER